MGIGEKEKETFRGRFVLQEIGDIVGTLRDNSGHFVGVRSAPTSTNQQDDESNRIQERS